MRKKIWKRIILVLVICVVGSVFFGTVYWIQKNQKQTVETKNNEEDKIENYKSGETITLSDVYQEADVDQITYIAFQLQKAVESENKYDHSIYFVKKSDLVERVLKQLEEKKYEAGNTPYIKMDHVKDKWWIWLGYKEDRSILLSASTTKWAGVCLSRFILALPGESRVVDDSFLEEYFVNGLFLSDDVTEVLQDIIQNSIQAVSMAQVKEMAEKDEPELRDFQQYYYDAGWDSKADVPVFTFPLEGDVGTVEVRYHSVLGLEKNYIYSIVYKDEAGQITEVLYDTGEIEVQ